MPRAVQFSAFGDPDVLQTVDVPEQHAGPGQVRISVRAAGVNPFDWKVRRGLMADGAAAPSEPRGLGSDVAGVIDEVGVGVTAFSVGDEVLGVAVTPTYAEQALAEPRDLVRRPAGIPWEVAGAIGSAGRTAYRILRMLDLLPGETLLIHGAAGGVGVFADQLAVARGVRVIGTAGPSNHEFLRSLGVTPVTYGEGLEARVREVAPEGVDAVFDAAGKGALAESVALAGGPERVITIADGNAAEYGVRASWSVDDADTSGALPEIVERIGAGQLQVPIWRTFPLTEAAAAHAASEHGHVRGKIVLLP